MRPGFFLLLLPVLLLTRCGVLTHLPPYTPRIVFTGEINGEATTLAGDLTNPDSCVLRGDSVVMTMYSDDYSPTSIPSGTLLRIKVFPQPGDTAFPFGDAFTERDVQLHCVVFSQSGTTCSSYVTPDDTLTKTQTISLNIVQFSPTHGGTIEFNNIGATWSNIGTGCVAEGNGIVNGTIKGTVE